MAHTGGFRKGGALLLRFRVTPNASAKSHETLGGHRGCEKLPIPRRGRTPMC